MDLGAYSAIDLSPKPNTLAIAVLDWAISSRVRSLGKVMLPSSFKFTPACITATVVTGVVWSLVWLSVVPDSTNLELRIVLLPKHLGLAVASSI